MLLQHFRGAGTSVAGVPRRRHLCAVNRPTAITAAATPTKPSAGAGGRAGARWFLLSGIVLRPDPLTHACVCTYMNIYMLYIYTCGGVCQHPSIKEEGQPRKYEGEKKDAHVNKKDMTRMSLPRSKHKKTYRSEWDFHVHYAYLTPPITRKGVLLTPPPMRALSKMLT